MYLFDDRFSTVVAFVEGYNAAFDGVPLSGFQEYVAKRIVGGPSGLHWSYIIASMRVPEVLRGEIRIDHIPIEVEGVLTEKLLDLLEGYQAQNMAH